jgi:hypothetical protein
MEKTSCARARNKTAVETLLAKPVRQIPEGGLATLRRKARECHACGLWKHATQTVFGAGADHARIMLIGEQPGQQEDIQGGLQAACSIGRSKKRRSTAVRFT